MSTKIYDAYRTRHGLKAILAALKTLREKLGDKWKSDVASFLTGTVLSDSSDSSNTRCDLSYTIHVGTTIMQGMNGHNPTASAVVYPHPDGGDVVQLFGLDNSPECKTLLKTFLRRLKATDYHYQNQVDQPERVSQSEWNLRRKYWDIMLPGAGVPEENGFTFELITKQKAIEILLEGFSRRNQAHTQLVTNHENWAYVKSHDFIRHYHARDMDDFDRDIRSRRASK